MKHDLPIINLNLIMFKDMNQKIFTQKNGVYLTEKGNRLLAKLVFDVIKENIKIINLNQINN